MRVYVEFCPPLLPRHWVNFNLPVIITWIYNLSHRNFSSGLVTLVFQTGLLGLCDIGNKWLSEQQIAA